MKAPVMHTKLRCSHSILLITVKLERNLCNIGSVRIHKYFKTFDHICSDVFFKRFPGHNKGGHQQIKPCVYFFNLKVVLAQTRLAHNSYPYYQWWRNWNLTNLHIFLTYRYWFDNFYPLFHACLRYFQQFIQLEVSALFRSSMDMIQVCASCTPLSVYSLQLCIEILAGITKTTFAINSFTTHFKALLQIAKLS